MGVRCDRCMMAFKEGALRFEARLRLCGDTGGSVSAADAHASEGSLKRALQAAESLSDGELMESVVEELKFTLCPMCRDSVRADPAGAATMRVSGPRTPQ